MSPTALPTNITGTLSGLDALTLAQALEQQQAQELASRTQAATQAATQAGQQYQQAAQAPPPELNPIAALIPSLFGDVASILSQNPTYAERGQQQVQESRAQLLRNRADNLKASLQTWQQKAEEAQKAGDFEAEAKARSTLERQHRLYDEVSKQADRSFQSEQKQKDRENQLELQRLRNEGALMSAQVNASRPVGGATGQGFDPGSVAQSIIEGQVAPDPTGFSRGQWGMIVGEVRKLDPKFNLMKAGLDYRGVRQYVQTLNQGQQLRLRQNAQNATVTAGYIRDLIQEIRQAAPPRTPVTALNRAQLGAIKNGAYGPAAADAATRLEAQIAAWRLEMANVYSGGYAAQEAHLKEANHLIDPNWSLNRIEAGLGIGERDTNIRLNAVNEAGAMGPSNPLVPGAPPSGSVNIGPNAMPFGNPAPTLTAVEYKGKTYHFPDPKAAETFKKRLGIK